MFEQKLDKVKNGQGFIAALDQSGGSTPKALKLYGIEEDAYQSEEEMFDKVHDMRTRIITNKGFNGDRILGAILFENTLDREIEGMSSATYLWEKKNIVPFLKVDKGLADENQGVQLMKPMPTLTDLLKKASSQGVFGTKMRSVIKNANEKGIQEVVDQQFEVAKQIIDSGLIPIIEPEVDINCPEKVEAETILREALSTHLDALSDNQNVMLKLTLPNEDNFYKQLVDHPQVLRVVALSGGYPRLLANKKLKLNDGIIASFSRALTEGLSAKQNDDAFSEHIDNSIEEIYQASL